MSAVESWRELPGGEIEFTMRRPTKRLSDQTQSPAHRSHGVLAAISLSNGVPAYIKLSEVCCPGVILGDFHF
jgi:hypothetical protein